MLLIERRFLFKSRNQHYAAPEARDIRSGEGDGWVSPEGQYYMCSYLQHLQLVNQLYVCDMLGVPYVEDEDTLLRDDGESIAERLGWLKLKSGAFYHESRLDLTQAQLNTMFDFNPEARLWSNGKWVRN